MCSLSNKTIYTKLAELFTHAILKALKTEVTLFFFILYILNLECIIRIQYSMAHVEEIVH